MPRGADENRVKKRAFAFSLAYIKCFLAYSLSLSLRLPAQILYAGIHLPPQREARALPRRARNLQGCVPRLSPPLAGCPHPSRYGAKAPCRATFPKGKAERRVGTAAQPQQPLSHRWFLIKDIKALVCPFAVHRSRFGLRYSRVRGRRQSKFLASSSTGGARNFYPCTGEPRKLFASFLVRVISARSHRLWRGSESSLQHRQRIFHP